MDISIAQIELKYYLKQKIIYTFSENKKFYANPVLLDKIDIVFLTCRYLKFSTNCYLIIFYIWYNFKNIFELFESFGDNSNFL